MKCRKSRQGWRAAQCVTGLAAAAGVPPRRLLLIFFSCQTDLFLCFSYFDVCSVFTFLLFFWFSTHSFPNIRNSSKITVLLHFERKCFSFATKTKFNDWSRRDPRFLVPNGMAVHPVWPRIVKSCPQFFEEKAYFKCQTRSWSSPNRRSTPK